MIQSEVRNMAIVGAAALLVLLHPLEVVQAAQLRQ